MIVESIPPSALRQPPRPGRCLLINPNTEGDTPRARSRPLYSRTSIIESLPDELLIEILSRLSADEIYEKARLVCRRWCHLIHTDALVSTHLHHATSGLLLTSPLKFVTAATQGRVKVSELSCRIRFPVLCGCNGLVLGLRRKGSRKKAPFIFNFATKCAFNLPNFPVRGQPLYQLVMTYAAASMAYKVVGSYVKTGAVALAQCAILTVGVDKTWRHVALEELCPKSKWLITSRPPLITGGFVHWVCASDGSSLNMGVDDIFSVSLNVETEMFTESPIIAPGYQKHEYKFCCLSTGEYLTLLVSCGDWLWDVWEMKPGTWEWRKVLHNINLEAQIYKIKQFASRERREDDVLTPAGWVRYPEVLAFYFQWGCYCIIYNLDTDKFEPIRLYDTDYFHCIVQHKNSLVWLERC